MRVELIEVDILIHRPVLLKEAVDSLNLKLGDVVVDATVGGGGHAKEILKRITPGGRLIGLDGDEYALKRAEENLKEYSGSFTLIRENFRDLDHALLKEGIKAANAVLMDVGISSFQMDDKARGFSIKLNDRLDMRSLS